MTPVAKTPDDQAPDQDQKEPEKATDKETGFYCPGCGARSSYIKDCTGPAAAPHPAIEMVDVAELEGDPEKHTPAPSSENLG